MLEQIMTCTCHVPWLMLDKLASVFIKYEMTLQVTSSHKYNGFPVSANKFVSDLRKCQGKFLNDWWTAN